MANEQASESDAPCPLNNPQCTVEKKVEVLNNEIAALKKLVITDALTGLFNASHMRHSLTQEMERTRRQHHPTAFIILDADHFKKFNDTYGHVMGDRVLKHLAATIRSAIRQIDIPCRYGGEEFAVILPSSPLLVGTQVAERIRSMVEENPLIDEEKALKITVSCGVAMFTGKQQYSVDEFIATADKQLYLAKENGRNRVHHETEQTMKTVEVSTDEKQALFDQLNDENE